MGKEDRKRQNTEYRIQNTNSELRSQNGERRTANDSFKHKHDNEYDRRRFAVHPRPELQTPNSKPDGDRKIPNALDKLLFWI